MKNKASVALFVLFILLVLPLRASSQTNNKNIKLGTLTILQPLMSVLGEGLEKKGYNVEVVLFDANNMPAIATKDGDIDGFMHNHVLWIDTFNKEQKSNLEMLKPYLFYYRMALYSLKHENVQEFPDGATIAVGNDPTNLENSLLFLQGLKLLKLGPKNDTFYNVLDIIENPKKIILRETEISTTARSITDADAVICPAIRVKVAGIDPNSFLAEDPASRSTAVGITIDSKNKNEKWVNDAMTILKSDRVKNLFNDQYAGALVLFE